MTTLDLRTLRLRSGDHVERTEAIELEPFQLGGQRYDPDPAVPAAAVTISRPSSGLLFRLAFETRLGGPCVRCLGDAGLDVAVDATEYQDASPGAADELATPYLVDGRLDLGQWARDAVGLELPDKILCRPDCAGLCPECGRNLNDDPHEHARAEPDPRWAKLAELRDAELEPGGSTHVATDPLPRG